MGDGLSKETIPKLVEDPARRARARALEAQLDRRETEFGRIMDHTVDGCGTFACDDGFTLLRFTGGSHSIHALCCAQYRQPTIELIHPDDREAVQAALRTAVAGGEPLTLRYRVTDGADGWVWVLAKGVMQGELYRGLCPTIYFVFIDISEMMELSKRYENEQARSSLLLEREKYLMACVRTFSSSAFVPAMGSLTRMICDYYDAGRATMHECHAEGEAARLAFESGQNTPEALQLLPAALTAGCCAKNGIGIDLRHSTDVPLTAAARARLRIAGCDTLLAAPILYHRHLYGMLTVMNPRAHSEDVEFLRTLAFFVGNGCEIAKAQRSLEELSYVDSLTGLQNRNAYNRMIDRLKGSADGDTGVVFMDANGLKYVNDTYGHKFGDRMLRNLADILRSCFEPEEVFRISGDEFVVRAIPGDKKRFWERVRRLTEALEQHNDVLAAVGAIWDTDGFDTEKLVRRAEKIMYVNKQRYYEDSSERRRPGKRYMDEFLQQLNGRQFLPYFQPQCDVESRVVTGAEALVRMLDDEGRLVYPGEFVPVLEQECLIAKLDYSILEQVCVVMSRWKSEGRRPVTISVNCSRVTMLDEEFLPTVCGICDRYGVDRSRIKLEITESATTTDRQRMKESIARLRREGFGLALDDMGVEYSSLGMLLVTGFDVIKLDKAFIDDIETDSRTAMLIRMIIRYCHSQSMRCVAEGVETESQLNLLREMECDSIQGYYIDRAISAEHFAEKYL